MANISQYLENIMAAIYGEQVRGSIHDAIDEINNEVIVANTKSDSAVEAAESASTSAAAATAAQEAAEAAQTAAEEAEDRNEAAVSAAEANTLAYKTAAEAARNSAETLSGSAAASASSASSFANIARQAAAQAQQAAYGDLDATSIPLNRSTDDTYMVSDETADLREKIESQTLLITFSDLAFTPSGGRYAAIVVDEGLRASMKPGYIIPARGATLPSGLDIEVFDGFLTMEADELPSVLFSGEVFIHRIGSGEGSGGGSGGGSSGASSDHTVQIIGESLVITSV